MRFGKKQELDKRIVRKKFAFLPQKIQGQWRWLEWIEERGYYFVTQISNEVFWYHTEYLD
jgi:hypothetical protein